MKVQILTICSNLVASAHARATTPGRRATFSGLSLGISNVIALETAKMLVHNTQVFASDFDNYLLAREAQKITKSEQKVS